MTEENVTEQELIEKAKAPRVTKEDLKANIVSQYVVSASYAIGGGEAHDAVLGTRLMRAGVSNEDLMSHLN